jgi:prolyl-tRNA editing enzyme YbaK/EbsC (Cys-tRNA(Pro) deacylase)
MVMMMAITPSLKASNLPLLMREEYAVFAVHLSISTFVECRLSEWSQGQSSGQIDRVVVGDSPLLCLYNRHSRRGTMQPAMHNELHDRLRAFIADHHIDCEHLIFAQSTHSVAEAAQAAGVTPEDFVKSVCMVTKDGRIVVAIVKGEDRADRGAVQRRLGLSKLSIASPEVMLEKTGYPAGGTPPFGFDATFLMDERVFEKQIVYAGGGSDCALIRIAPQEMQRANNARIAIIRKLAADDNP